MAEINEAYRVLSDPGRRALYDARLRGVATGSTDVSPTVDAEERVSTRPPNLEPARIPWRMLLFVGVIAVVGIVVLAQFTDPGEPDGPDGILRIGDCVEIEIDNDAREVACTDDPLVDLVVRAFVPFDGRCPGGTLAHRDRQGMGVACVATGDR